MHWPDENYVKLYTRETPNWLLLPWQSRLLFPAIMKKSDKAGLMDLGTDHERALAAYLSVPIEFVKAGLPALLDSGTCELRDGVLITPGFLEAQEARKTNAAACREYRERMRDEARAANRLKPLDGTNREQQTAPPSSPAQPLKDLGREAGRTGKQLSQQPSCSTHRTRHPSHAAPVALTPVALTPVAVASEVVAPEATAPEVQHPKSPHPKLSQQQAWAEKAQIRRLAMCPGLLREHPDAARLNTNLKTPLAEIGTAGLDLAYGAFLADDWARGKGWPWSVFVAGIPKYHAAALAVATSRQTTIQKPPTHYPKEFQ